MQFRSLLRKATNAFDHKQTHHASTRDPNAMDTSKLLSLPPEIRNQIYHLALTQDKPLPSTVICEPGLLATNRQTRREALPIYYSENTFEGPLCQAGDVWLGIFGNERAGHIQCFYWDATLSRAGDARRLLTWLVGCLVRSGLENMVGALRIRTLFGGDWRWFNLAELEAALQAPEGGGR